MSHDTKPSPICPDAQSSREVLKEALLCALSPEPAGWVTKRGRPTLLSGEQLAATLLWCLLIGWQSVREVWRVIRLEGFGSLPPVRISDQAVYNRLHRQGVRLLEHLFERVSLFLQQRLLPYEQRHLAPFAKAVLALDESVLDKLCSHKGRPKEKAAEQAEPKSRWVPKGRIAALLDVRTGLWHRLDVLPDGRADCKVHARAMLSAVQEGTLLLFDRGYASFRWYDELTEAGLFWISRPAKAESYPVEQVLLSLDGLCEGLVWIGGHRTGQARFLVRQVRLRYQGRWFTYLTNVLDPSRLSLADIVSLYEKRWLIEDAFRLIQDYLGLHVHWSEQWTLLGCQVWATLTIAQLYHGLQVELAAQAGVEVAEVSVRLLARWAPRLLTHHRVKAFLQEIGVEVGLIRPSRRIRRLVPVVNWHDYLPLPPDLPLERPPRYRKQATGHRKPPS